MDSSIDDFYYRYYIQVASKTVPLCVIASCCFVGNLQLRHNVHVSFLLCPEHHVASMKELCALGLLRAHLRGKRTIPTLQCATVDAAHLESPALTP